MARNAETDQTESGASAPTEMVERVARALVRIINEATTDLGSTEVERLAGLHWQWFTGYAREVIAEMREPDDQMVMSGFVDYAVTSDVRRVWRGMIDVARTGEPSELDKTSTARPAQTLRPGLG